MAASYAISSPSSPSSSSPPSPDGVHRTNTLAITSIPKSFFHPVVMDILRNHFESFGVINQWAALPGFGRIIVVYEQEEDAEVAKLQCDPIILEATHDRSQTTLRVFRADPNPIIAPGSASTIPEANYLQPPAIEKNFLISPPGSPPVGWEPIKEDPPNDCVLADDLISALRKLKTHEDKRQSSLSVLLDPHDGSGVGVYVEDFDYVPGGEMDISEEDWVYGESAPARSKWIHTPTALPPLRSTVPV